MGDARRVIAAALLVGLVGCVQPPEGAQVPECEGIALDRPMTRVDPLDDSARQEPVTIECWRESDRERVELWYALPPGPTCWRLTAVELRESADAVGLALTAGTADDATGGACAPEPASERTVVELQAPLADRVILDVGGG
jgi:hypothetical protein